MGFFLVYAEGKNRRKKNPDYSFKANNCKHNKSATKLAYILFEPTISCRGHLHTVSVTCICRPKWMFTNPLYSLSGDSFELLTWTDKQQSQFSFLVEHYLWRLWQENGFSCKEPALQINSRLSVTGGLDRAWSLSMFQPWLQPFSV